MNNENKRELSAAELDAVVGGGWKSKVAKGAISVGKSVGDGVRDGFKALGRWGTVAGTTEAGSRGLETATDGSVRVPRPSDAVSK